MRDDFTSNSYYLTYTFLLKRLGRMYFSNLGVKGFREHSPVSPNDARSVIFEAGSITSFLPQ